MRAVTKTLSAGLFAAAAAVGLAIPATAASAAPAASAASAAPAAPAAVSAASPGTGFLYGTDSWPITIANTAPLKEPVIGTNYGGYMGMAGNWARTLGCKTGNMFAWTPVNAGQANKNFRTYNTGVGTGVYWYMGGPGVDPKWNGSAAEAYHWGQEQASLAIQSVRNMYIPYPVLWADIELPGIAPATDNGWNSVYTSPCSGVRKESSVPAVVDRNELNGFANYLTGHSKFKLGVYSSPLIWDSIFGTGSYASIPTTYEWTYTPETSHLTSAPSGWCLAGTKTCAEFFGGVTSASKYALMWQWSGGGGVSNGVGDFDQIDVARMK
ncbi:MAG TPA: hypothetical protein VGM12_06695 [Trebonia sp.]|jgi:hypothetical protein